MISMFLTKQLTSYSLKTIGLQFGGRDHSTVIHAINTVDEKLKTDPDFKQDMTAINKEINLKTQ